MSISQLVIDGSELKTIFDNIFSTIVTVALSIITNVFSVFLDWFASLIAGTFFTNPGILLIGVALLFTAWRVSVSG